ncbi:MAG: diaminopimelate epimerase [Flavobacteriales bacterium]|nr:diaminopimelate epimerase [Flavobacteriales bacterium]
MYFSKYQGTGNDFIVLNNMDRVLKHDSHLAQKLCDRHFGIGSDGLIILEPSEDKDFKMVFYNPDGSMSFCGNGSRCAVRFALDSNIISADSADFYSTDGPHTAIISKDEIRLSMNQPAALKYSFDLTQLPNSGHDFLDTGSPHMLIFLSDNLDPANLNVKELGSGIRFSKTFAEEGININFIKVLAPDEIQIRTYERGVEDETLSCGTGVTASALAYHARFNKQHGMHNVRVKTQGGELSVQFKFNDSYQDVYLTGPAEFVFKGEI